MVSQKVRTQVQEELRRLEAERQVTILYACESGSRAWGFESRDSDYDVRFVYVHPRDWYLAVEDRRDVIELPLSEELDLSGWDLRKALRLLSKSNPPLWEWFKSPIVYCEVPPFAAEFNSLAAEFYSPRRCFSHYLHMGEGNWRKYLAGRERVSLKKYLYVFRPLLACRWIQRNRGPVPMLFQELVDAVLEEADVRAELARLLERKKAGFEGTLHPPVDLLSRFIESELAVLAPLSGPQEDPIDLEPLNRFFLRYCPAE